MISTIYEPKGKAREYSPLALNIYTACDHGCTYCYAKKFFNGPAVPRKGLLEALEKRLTKGPKVEKQVLLSFTSDPYCHAEQKYGATSQVLEILLEHQVPTAILTKGGGNIVVGDFDLFTKFKRFQLGTTLTFENQFSSFVWEPRASFPINRIKMLEVAKSFGLKTFVSFEPVIYPDQSLRLMETAAPFSDHYRIGRWNHDSRAAVIDWLSFGLNAVAICRKLKKPFYVKNDLAKVFPDGFLRPEERNPELFEI